jgi:hypothetical protein
MEQPTAIEEQAAPRSVPAPVLRRSRSATQLPTGAKPTITVNKTNANAESVDEGAERRNEKDKEKDKEEKEKEKRGTSLQTTELPPSWHSSTPGNDKQRRWTRTGRWQSSRPRGAERRPPCARGSLTSFLKVASTWLHFGGGGSAYLQYVPRCAVVSDPGAHVHACRRRGVAQARAWDDVEFHGVPLANLQFSLKTATFHSFCFTILRIHSKLLGYDELSICSEGQQVRSSPSLRNWV